MNKKIANISLFLLGVAVIGFIAHQEIKRKNTVPDFLLATPFFDSIKVERRINGNIKPTEEIKIKSKINGIIEDVYVEIGQKVVKGQKIAVIQNLSEPMDIENLKSNIILYEISLERASLNYEREKKLSDAGLSSKTDFEAIEANYFQSVEQLESAKKKLQMLTTGVVSNEKELSNIIYAPAGGTILSLVSEKGSPVIKQNNYNEGTTLATIANMESLIFTGEITERDLSRIHIGQKLRIETSVNIKDKLYGEIKRIYPKGIEENGVVKFPIEASILNSEHILWGGLKATAIAIIEQKDSVLCVEQKYIEYEGDSTFVFTYTDKNEAKKQKILIGLSDNNKSEVISGLSINQKIKLPDEE